MQSALTELVTAKCPGEIVTSEGTDVKFSKDFEGNNSQVSAGEMIRIKHKVLKMNC